VHRFVYCMFKNGGKLLEDGLVVNYLDGNKANNHVDNLEACTKKENSQHAVDTRLLATRKPVQVTTADGAKKKFVSMKAVAKAMMVAEKLIGHLCHGRKTRKDFSCEFV
jgi:hypothetical protein